MGIIIVVVVSAPNVPPLAGSASPDLTSQLQITVQTYYE